MLHERFAERFEEWLGLIRDHQTVLGSSATGRIGSDRPRENFVGDPEAGLFYHPSIVTGVTKEDDLYTTETFGPIVPVTKFETFDEAVALADRVLVLDEGRLIHTLEIDAPRTSTHSERHRIELLDQLGVRI